MSLLNPKILEDSSSYHLLVDKIRIDEAHSILLGQATRRFGPPTAPQKAVLDGTETGTETGTQLGTETGTQLVSCSGTETGTQLVSCSGGHGSRN
jgi:hypothetical protein